MVTAQRVRDYIPIMKQILLKSNNSWVKGTARTVDITCSYLPGLKTQCAFTYHKDVHIVARITLAETFKSSGNTSRLLLNSSKTEKYNPGGQDLSHHLAVHIPGAGCPFSDVLPQLASPSLSPLTSILPTLSHYSLVGKRNDSTVRKKVRKILVVLSQAVLLRKLIKVSSSRHSSPSCV